MLLLIQKLHFMHFQPYDENNCVYLARIGRHVVEKAGENMTTRAQHRSIYFCIIYTSSWFSRCQSDHFWCL